MKNFMLGKSAFQSKGLKLNQMKTKDMVSKIGQTGIRPSCKKEPRGI